MPVDRSPTATPRPTTLIQEEATNVHADSDRSYLPSNNTGNPGESVHINANEFRLFKLPTFWHKQPKLWFAQLESEFLIFRIRSEEIKFNTIIRHLDEQALIAVADIVERPPEIDKYNQLKNALIKSFTDSEEKRLRQLLAGLELNDKKPSDLLREIKQLAGGAISDNILHSIWLQRLPYRVQATLAVVEGSPLVKLAELADKIMDRDSGLQVATIASPSESNVKSEELLTLERRIATLEVKCSRDRSRSRFKGKRKDTFKNRSSSKNKFVKQDNDEQICFYHRKFGVKAYKCTIPCSMSKHLTEKSEN